MRYAETSVCPCPHVPLVVSPMHCKRGSLAAHRYTDRVAQAHLCRSQYVVRYAHRRSHLRLIFNRMKCAMRYAETSVYPCQHVPAASPIHSKKGVILAAHRYAGRVAQAALLPFTICGARCVSHKFPHPIFNMMKCAMPTARATSAALRMSAIMGYALTCAPHKRALSKSRPPL